MTDTVPAGPLVEHPPAGTPHRSAGNGPARDVFISYAREDEPTAGRLRDLLESEGWDVWWDQNLRAGERWQDLLTRALWDAKAIVVLWSEHAVTSRWVRREARVAMTQLKLVPCTIDGTRPGPPLDAFEAARLDGWDGAATHRELPVLFAGLERLAQPARIDLVRPGYDIGFLGRDIGLPSILGVGDEFPYLHFSVIMNPGRRLPWYVAYNVCPQEFVPDRHDAWAPDPTLSRAFQPGHEHFRGTGFDRGHIAAVRSVAWGEERAATVAGRQAFFWTNTAPQTPELNQRTWAALEDLERRRAAESGRLTCFSGPVLRPDDPPHVVTDEIRGRLRARQTFRLPRSFWKVMVWPDGSDGLQVQCFEVANRLGVRRSAPQVRTLAEIERLTTLEFDAGAHAAVVSAELP